MNYHPSTFNIEQQGARHLYNIYCLFTSDYFSGVFVSCVARQECPYASRVPLMRVRMGRRKVICIMIILVLRIIWRWDRSLPLTVWKIPGFLTILAGVRRWTQRLSLQYYDTVQNSDEYDRVPVRKLSLDKIPHHFSRWERTSFLSRGSCSYFFCDFFDSLGAKLISLAK